MRICVNCEVVYPSRSTGMTDLSGMFFMVILAYYKYCTMDLPYIAYWYTPSVANIAYVYLYRTLLQYLV